jgi:hypothetical protein
MTPAMKREKKMTKRERKAQTPSGAAGHTHHDQHIHCVACGRHLDIEEFDANTATFLVCQHGSQFPACTLCRVPAQALLDEHDRTGRPVKIAPAHH